MAKTMYSIGYNTYILSLEDAVTVAEILSKAEVYEEKWRANKATTHHIYANAKNDLGTIKIISDTFYNMAKLAGPPPTKEEEA